MTGWTETCRSTVAPWECDLTEHFTVAYYLDRLEQASLTLCDLAGLGGHAQAGVFPRRITLRFTRELRAGASFHIESAPLSLGPGPRFGHRFVDSVTGEPVTWIEEVWEEVSLTGAEQRAAAPLIAAWDGPEAEARPEPPSMAGAIATARGRARPADLDEFGRFSLAAFVHRFTDALMQAIAAIGITADYMKSERRAYSTFELALRIAAAPMLGEPYLVETGIAHLGGSSVRFVHRMTDPRTGRELGRLGQFGVQLDLDARRPAPLPEPLRAAAQRLLLR